MTDTTEPRMTDERLVEIEAEYLQLQYRWRPNAGVIYELWEDDRRLRAELAAKEAECERYRGLLERATYNEMLQEREPDFLAEIVAALNPEVAQ